MLYITVKLYGKEKIRGEFKEYEKKALGIFKRHGGEIVVAYSPVPDKGGSETPDEIQILKIADQARFESFLGDPQRSGMAEERNAVIRKTEVYISEEIIHY